MEKEIGQRLTSRIHHIIGFEQCNETAAVLSITRASNQRVESQRNPGSGDVLSRSKPWNGSHESPCASKRGIPASVFHASEVNAMDHVVATLHESGACYSTNRS
jgi:hypothetical protein